MVNKRIIVLMLFLISCKSHRNEFHHLRIDIRNFNIKPNNNTEVYNYIDTCSFYKLLLNENLIKNRKNRKLDLNMVEGIKFYSKGKIGYFKNVDISDINTLDPKKAIMGIYNYSNEKVEIEFVVYNPQSGIKFWKESLLIDKITNDTITSLVKETADNIQYKKIYIPYKDLKNKLDW